MKRKRYTKELMDIFNRLYGCFGPQYWWPGSSPLEVCIGAILTQNTSWRNVEKAIENLKRHQLIDIARLHAIPASRLALLIKSSGYYNAKARKLKAFAGVIHSEYEARLDLLFELDVSLLRQRLLKIHGIGSETADAIILYAAGKPSFVIDAYTRRLFSRLGYCKDDISYNDMQAFFTDNLKKDMCLYNEYHALIDQLGKSICTPRNPKCGECPLGTVCRAAKKG